MFFWPNAAAMTIVLKLSKKSSRNKKKKPCPPGKLVFSNEVIF